MNRNPNQPTLSGTRGNLPNFVKNFLTNQKFNVRLGASQPELANQLEGIPQYSVFSVTYFGIAINNITKELSKDVQCILYVNDFTLFVAAIKERLFERLIQNAVKKV